MPQDRINLPLASAATVDLLNQSLAQGEADRMEIGLGGMIKTNLPGLRAFYDGSYQRDKDERTDNQPTKP